MKDHERCCDCGDPTGCAGVGEDSRYAPSGDGPYCEDCYIDALLLEVARLKEREGMVAAEMEAKLALTESKLYRLNDRAAALVAVGIEAAAKACTAEAKRRTGLDAGLPRSHAVHQDADAIRAMRSTIRALKSRAAEIAEETLR